MIYCALNSFFVAMGFDLSQNKLSAFVLLVGLEMRTVGTVCDYLTIGFQLSKSRETVISQISLSLALSFQPLTHIPFVSFAILFDKRYDIAFENCTVIRVSMIHNKVPRHCITCVFARLGRQLPCELCEFRFFQRQKIINKHCMSLGTQFRTFNQS